jgi:hypothetical protein
LVVTASGVRGMSRLSLLADHGLAGRVESKVGLGHQLLVEGRVNTAVGVEIASVVHLLLSSISIASTSTFEKLGEDRFLLLIHVLAIATYIVDLEPFALD